MLSNVEAIIFDMDGTLIDSMWLWREVDIEYLRLRNIKMPSDLQRAISGFSFNETAEYFKTRFNLPDSIEKIQKDWTDMVEYYYSSKINLKPGVMEFLKYLASMGYKLGVATSNSRKLTDAVLNKNNIYDFFEKIITTSEVSRDKSYPDVFLETAKQLNILPERCLVFEDTPSAIKGALAAGMKVVGVYDSYGAYTYEELSQLSKFIINDFNDILLKISES